MTPDPSAMIMIQAADEAGIPIIYQELGMPYHPPDFHSYYEQFTSVLPLCTEVAALSPMLVQHCRDKLPPQKRMSIIPIMSDEAENGRKPRQPPADRITFGFAARMEKLKGVMILIDAFAQAHQICGNLALNMAGDGSQRHKIASRVKALEIAGRYRYNGAYTHPEDCRAFMESLDVFVMPSFSEGTPNSIVEAMACGKPIIASDVGGIPDMIGEDAGILVPAGDVGALADAMILLATNKGLREQMGQSAKTRYQRLFAPTVVLPLLGSIYRRVTLKKRVLDSRSGNDHPWQVFHSQTQASGGE
jgi:glycosyltransferase involved in cell wall biosynthesis